MPDSSPFDKQSDRRVGPSSGCGRARRARPIFICFFDQHYRVGIEGGSHRPTKQLERSSTNTGTGTRSPAVHALIRRTAADAMPSSKHRCAATDIAAARPSGPLRQASTIDESLLVLTGRGLSSIAMKAATSRQLHPAGARPSGRWRAALRVVPTSNKSTSQASDGMQRPVDDRRQARDRRPYASISDFNGRPRVFIATRRRGPGASVPAHS